MRTLLKLTAAAAAGTIAGGVGVIVYATRTVLSDMCDTSPVGRGRAARPVAEPARSARVAA